MDQVISTYNRFGVAAVETPGKGGRRRQYLTLEEEDTFLTQVARDFATYYVVMQVDQAGWHRATDLKVPENIRPSPPGSLRTDNL